MSLNAARHASAIVRNSEHILALELVCGAQAVTLQLGKRGNRNLRPGRGTQAVLNSLRAAGIAPLHRDRVLYPDLRKAIRLVRGGDLVRAARHAISEGSSC
jgi:histidine ammonia-lyase